MTDFISQLSFVFDIVIILLLAATIYFAVKLSRHLDSFRSNRADMENLIRELSRQITRAQEGISVLDELSASRGDELRSSVSKAQAMVDELHVMTESGDSLAQRLETMAIRNREMIDEMDKKALGLVYPNAMAKASPSAAVPPLTASRVGGQKMEKLPADDSPFTIRDPDYDDDQEQDYQGDSEIYPSKAERDLAEALKRRSQK